MVSIPLHNIKREVVAHTIIDDADFPLVSLYTWCLSGHGYVVANIKVNGVPHSRMLHRLLMQPGIAIGEECDWRKRQVDHINGDGLDNRRSNLRWASVSQNQANRPAPASNTSGAKGVSWCKERGKWSARIQIHGKVKALGRYSNKDDAAAAYARAASAAFGEYAGGIK